MLKALQKKIRFVARIECIIAITFSFKNKISYLSYARNRKFKANLEIL